jgi:hypothetical protein
MIFQPGGVLALDLSTHAGWAYGLPGDPMPQSGVWELPIFAINIGRCLAEYENALLKAFVDMQPSVVSMEAALPIQAQTHQLTAEQQMYLAGATQPPTRVRKVNTVRAAVLGNGKLTKAEAKPAVLAWCHSRGWYPVDHNAGDALVVWSYETGIRFPRQSVRRVQPVLERAGA